MSGKDFYMGSGKPDKKKDPKELGDWQQMAVEEGLGFIDNSYAALQAARIKKNHEEQGTAEESEVVTNPSELAKAEAAFREQLHAKLPEDASELCLPDFPMIPCGEKVIIKPLAQGDFVVNKIVHIQTVDNPGGKCSLGIVAAIGREVRVKMPYLKVGDIVYFNPLSGSRLNLLYGGKGEDLYILWSLNIEASYYGAINAVYGKGDVVPVDEPKEGAHLVPPPSMTGNPAKAITDTLIN